MHHYSYVMDLRTRATMSKGWNSDSRIVYNSANSGGIFVNTSKVRNSLCNTSL